MASDTLVILGSGYTARFVLQRASSLYTNVFATSRTPNRHPAHLPAEQRLYFDLAVPQSWHNIPPRADWLWCFPAVPLDLVQQFAATLPANTHRVVVLGSTSAYDIDRSAAYPPPWIDETAPIDWTKPRVQGEEFLRTQCGATVLRVAGIYGPGRNPIEWISTGRVGPSRKFVNLIHVEDLAAVCLLALQQGVPGEIYNVSDGTPRTWKEICDRAHARFGVTPHPTPVDEQTGKRISTAKLIQKLGYVIRHPDFFDALDKLYPPLSGAGP